MPVKPKSRRKTTTEYSGLGDAVRSLELLWGMRSQPSRGPKPGLTLERIVKAAIEIADSEGLSALSMQRVAGALGFTAMSLYRYVPGKAELLELMLDTVGGETPLIGDLPGGWRDKLERSAREDWALFHRHPWILQVTPVRPVMGPNGMALYDSQMRAIAGVGLTGREMISVVHMLDGYVRGVGRLSVDALYAEGETGITDEKWWSDRAYFWEKLFDPQRHPMLAELWSSGALDTHPFTEEIFEFGLQRVLDGIEALIKARAAGLSGNRDESRPVPRTPALPRDETRRDNDARGKEPRCILCGKAVPPAATGRPRAYCSRACQQRAYRARKASG